VYWCVHPCSPSISSDLMGFEGSIFAVLPLHRILVKALNGELCQTYSYGLSSDHNPYSYRNAGVIAWCGRFSFEPHALGTVISSL
jgi:hypothetical protein